MANYNSLKNAGVLAPAANTDLGSATNRYANVFMSGNINMSGTSLSVNTIVTPKVSSIVYPGDDTAANIAGGQTITLNGNGFQVGASVLIAGTVVGSVSFISSTQLTFVSPATSAGSYVLYVINTDGGTAISIPGIQYSGVPTWTTSAGSLGSIAKSTSVNINIAATGDAPITYSVYSGSLPSGVSLNTSTGAITGTAPNETSTTTYNFTIRATDGQNQDTDRAFSLTVNAIIIVPISYLVVGPGGAAGGTAGTYGAKGGGGGSGGATYGTVNYNTPGTSFTVTVGTSTGPYYQPGTNSSLVGTGFTRTAYAGGNGGPKHNNSNSAGYDGYVGLGGAQGDGNTSVGGTQGTGGQYVPGTNGSAGTYSGGGGGGAGGNSLSYPNGGTGGAGGQRNWTSQPLWTTVDPSWGNGGAMGTNDSGTQGIVIIKYPDSYAAAASYTGSYSVTGGYRIYTFGSSGSITF
jgi:hypothetical protein